MKVAELTTIVENYFVLLFELAFRSSVLRNEEISPKTLKNITQID
jgi:hypothetical protein